MKKGFSAILGVVVLIGFGFAAYSIQAGNGKLPWSKLAQNAEKPSVITVREGTQIELILLEGIDAGGTKEGETVDMGVLKDIKLQGHVVIPMGARAKGTVSKSRGASLIGAISNRPARLEIELNSVIAADGQEIPIETLEGKITYQFTQENTSDRLDAAKIDNLWNDAEARNALVEIAQGTFSGTDLKVQEENVIKLADRLGLEKTQQLSREPGSKMSLEAVLGAVAENDMSSLNPIESILMAEAVGEISDLVSSVDHKMRGIFKGRTIRATIGTPVMVKTRATSNVTVKKSN